MPPPTAARPRVEGDREQEVLTAALDVLAEVGYDRLTMDAVAAAARASKATLYRRWSGKAALVVEALLLLKGPLPDADTGTLRGDLLAMFCGTGGLTDRRQTAVLASVVTALTRDEEFAAAFRTHVVEPKTAVVRAVFERAAARGELRPGLDVDLLASALPGVVLHREFLLGEPPSPDLVTRVLDQIVLPAALAPHAHLDRLDRPNQNPNQDPNQKDIP